MNDCLTWVGQNLISDCTNQPKGGNEKIGWLLLRDEIASFTYDPTNPSIIDALTMESTKKAYSVTVNFKGIDTGHDFVEGADGFADAFTHFASVKIFQKDVATKEFVDALSDVVLIVEDSDKTLAANGVFKVYGLLNGLFKTSDTQRDNSDRGVRLLELGSRAEQEEKYSNYNFWKTDYAVSKAAVLALEIPAA